MISEVRELNDAELDEVAGGIDLGSLADAVGTAASRVGVHGGVGVADLHVTKVTDR